MNLAETYRGIKDFVIEKGYAGEIAWQQGLRLEDLGESSLLAEAAWVVLSSGMRETIVRKTFPLVSESFLWWESAAEIARSSRTCVDSALKCFNHAGKINAIAKIAAEVGGIGFARLREEIRIGGVERLRRFPYMGPATSYHLAKNIGLDVAKPDRHLVRIAEASGHRCPDFLCRDLSQLVGDRVAVVDLVLWRYATLVPDYLGSFAATSRPQRES